METTDEQDDALVVQIKEKIKTFIREERLQPKLDKLKEGEDEKRQKLLQDHRPESWIADAAHRVGQIQQVTHARKYTHPDAKGSNISSQGNPEARQWVASHSIGERGSPDVVGNAAALDVYKFLRLEINGKTLLKRSSENDSSLLAALSDNAEQATVWMESFAALTERKGAPSSHTLAKQIYWPLTGEGYHLLAPLFPSSLVHKVWSTLREDRFSEEAKAAREARRSNIPFAHGYREYPNVVIQQFGGTNPQNISQLNIERHGENYLLPSLPPQWNSDPLKPPLRVESVFDGWFARRRRVRELVKILSGFLYSVQEVKSNRRIRNKRIELVGYLVDEMLLFAAELRELDVPWTLHESCKLNINEQCWFNPVRAKTDPEFSTVYNSGEWKEDICKHFSNWLNARLSKPNKPLPFDESSARQWMGDLEKELGLLHLEVDSYE